MIRKAFRHAIGFLGSAKLAAWLLGFVGVWSMVATFVAQGDVSDPAVATWVSANPLFEPIVQPLGLHQAFTAPLFIVCAVVLGVSTALCAWRRTKVAVRKARTLRAASEPGGSLLGRHDFELTCGAGIGPDEILPAASDTLRRLGVKTRLRDGRLIAVSSPWSVWGSPVFHWALVALIAVFLVSALQRSEGIMGVAVGETKVDAPASYGVLQVGPLHSWGAQPRSIRVDAFEPDYSTGGVERGPTPTVSVLDSSGRVLKTQRVYPNMPLEIGSLTIHPSEYGLAVTLAALTAADVETSRFVALVDFAPSAPDGTAPVRPFQISDSTGTSRLTGVVTVPLDRVDGGFALPQERKAHVVLSSPDGSPAIDSSVSQGDIVTLPWGDRLKVASVGYYVRLSVVDDWSIPALYAALALAFIGLTATLVSRQQIVVVSVAEGPDGPRLVARLHLSRNAATNRSEIEGALTQVLGPDKQRSTL